MASDSGPYELAGGLAVVTGAASGIGFGVAAACANEGMRVVLADVEEPALEAAVAKLAEGGADVSGVATDVSDPDSVDALAEQVGDVDLLVNNAGVAGGLGMTWELPVQTWDWVLGTNLRGVVHGIRSFVPRMVARNRGYVVNMSSVGGLMALPASGPYVASKFGIVALSEVLAEELAMREADVGVTVVCPGEVKSAIADDVRNWPARLGPVPEPSADPELSALAEEIRGAIEGAPEPDALAADVLAAVRSRTFWVVPDAVPVEAVQQRAEAVTAAAPADG